MTEPLTDEDVEEIRSRHRPRCHGCWNEIPQSALEVDDGGTVYHHGSGKGLCWPIWCDTCECKWPCPEIRLSDERDALAGIIAAIREEVPEADGCPDGDLPSVLGTMLEGIGLLAGQRDALEAENARLRDKVSELNRRAQQAEAGVRERIEAGNPERRTFGRVLANAGAAIYRRERDEAVAALERLHRAIDDIRLDLGTRFPALSEAQVLAGQVLHQARGQIQLGQYRFRERNDGRHADDGQEATQPPEHDAGNADGR